MNVVRIGKNTLLGGRGGREVMNLVMMGSLGSPGREVWSWKDGRMVVEKR